MHLLKDAASIPKHPRQNVPKCDVVIGEVTHYDYEKRRIELGQDLPTDELGMPIEDALTLGFLHHVLYVFFGLEITEKFDDISIFFRMELDSQ